MIKQNFFTPDIHTQSVRTSSHFNSGHYPQQCVPVHELHSTALGICDNVCSFIVLSFRVIYRCNMMVQVEIFIKKRE